MNDPGFDVPDPTHAESTDLISVKFAHSTFHQLRNLVLRWLGEDAPKELAVATPKQRPAVRFSFQIRLTR